MSLCIISRSIKLITINNLFKVYPKNQVKTAQKLVQVSVPNGAYFSSKPSTNIVFEKDPETGETKKKKTPKIPKITLLSGNDLSITTIEEAQKLAKRRDLKLVKIVDIDTKTQRPVYRLMSGTEYFQEDLKQKEKKKCQKQSTIKGEKTLIMSQNISEHDLDVHIGKIVKWLSKKYEVRLAINGSSENMSKAEHVYSLLEQKLKAYNSRIFQKRIKGSDIKFQVLPPKEDKNFTESGITANLNTSSGSGGSVSNDSGGGKSL